MTTWKLKRDEQEYPATLDTLREWARLGRVLGTDYVYNPTLERWMFARETPELEGLTRTLAPHVQQPEAKAGASTAVVRSVQLAFALILVGVMFAMWGAIGVAVLCWSGTLLFFVVALLAHVFGK